MSVPSDAATAGLAGKLRWFLLAALVVAADLGTKAWIFDDLRMGRHEWLLGNWFGLTKVWNPGMMWGLFPDHPEVLVWGRVAAALAVVWMIVSTPAGSRLLLTALGLVLGGAVGNIYDGFAFGQVRDFLMVDLDLPGFDPFPIFNVADSAISVGVALLALGMLLEGRRAAREARVAESAPGDASDGGAGGL